MVEPEKIFLTTSLITVQNSTAAGHTVWAHAGDAKNLGCESPTPSCVTLLKHTPPHMCYHTKFSRLSSYRMVACRGSIIMFWDIGSPLGMRTWLTRPVVEVHPSPYVTLPM